MNDMEWPVEQYELYGMFACIAEMECEHALAESIRLETAIEGMSEAVAKGEAEMAVWLRLYLKRAIKRVYHCNPFPYYVANPLTLH